MTYRADIADIRDALVGLRAELVRRIDNLNQHGPDDLTQVLLLTDTEAAAWATATGRKDLTSSMRQLLQGALELQKELGVPPAPASPHARPAYLVGFYLVKAVHPLGPSVDAAHASPPDTAIEDRPRSVRTPRVVTLVERTAPLW